jgi:hypothetical protein
MSTLLDLLRDLGQEVPGLMSTAVVHLGDGTSVGASVTQEGFFPEASDAWFTEIFHKHRRAMDALGLVSETEDILTTTRDAFFLARALPGTPYLWTMTVSRAGSLGFARAVMRKRHELIVAALP